MNPSLVLDASVIVKWLVRESQAEKDADRAFAILHGFQRRELDLRAPSHWLVEVAAVISRLAPTEAAGAILDLHRLHIPVVEGIEVIQLAAKMAIELDAHLFDTLYHAAALSVPSAQLITADERYYKRAMRSGRIVLLANWRLV